MADKSKPPTRPSRLPPRLKIADVLNRKPREAAFVLPGLMAGTVGVLVSAGGVGKSKLALAMAASVATGRDWWSLIGEDPKQGGVVLISAEDPEIILEQRLHALRDQVPKDEQAEFIEMLDQHLHVLPAQGHGFSLGIWDGRQFSPSEQLNDLETLVGGDGNGFEPRLLVIDTLNRCLNGISENDNAAMGRIVSAIETVVQQNPIKAAVLVLHHTSKGAALSGTGDQQQAARGASALTDNARLQMNLTTMTEREAELYEPRTAAERSRWVRLSVPKSNYSRPIEDRWLHKTKDILIGEEPPPAKTSVRTPRTTAPRPSVRRKNSRS